MALNMNRGALPIFCSLCLAVRALQSADAPAAKEFDPDEVKRERPPVGYAQSLRESGRDWKIEILDPLDWLDVGLEVRTRYETRDRDYRDPALPSDDALLTRALAFIQVREQFDPFRFAVEIEDSRRFGGSGAERTTEVNHVEPLQFYSELWFTDAIGSEPLSVRMGRMTIDFVDRRLVARNRHRNTINAYDGARLLIGDDASPWQVDAFLVYPVTRSLEGVDSSTDETTLLGLSSYWRRWAPGLVLEPYWLGLDRARDGKQIQTIGVHASGNWPGEHWDYDIDLASQYGESDGRDHSAWAAHVEAGHTWDHPWKPRLAAWLNYASGDRDPTDGKNDRFDPLYGASFSFYGYTGYFNWANLINPAVRFRLCPNDRVKCEAIYRGMWLASDHDSWARANRVDPTGKSGNFVGQELDLRIAYKLTHYLEVEWVQGLFLPGSFVENTGSAPGSSYGYWGATWRF